MQRILKVISMWLFLSVLLTSCVLVTRVPTATAVLSRTSIPTNTGLPESSPTATLSQVENLFSIPTRQSLLPEAPTPIATPKGEASTSTLRNLTEEEALNLAYEMNEYSYRNFPSFQGWWTDGQFIASQEPVGLAIQEYLYRYPESPNAYRLGWQLAYINAILYGGIHDGLAGSQYDDQLIVSELDKKLNEGEVQREQLEIILNLYWFDVAYQKPIENLFGDEKTAWLYVITPQVWKEETDNINSLNFFPRGGLFFVVRQYQGDEFQIYLLESAWSFINGASSVYIISDHNQNGTPEIALNLGLHGGTMCAGKFKIFEWKEKQFIDLTNGELLIGDCTDNIEYSISEEKPSILYKHFYRAPALYVWNGSKYEFADFQDSNPVEKWSLSRSPSEEAQAIEAILASPDRQGLSHAQIDFLRYRLGIAYALDSDVSEVERVLQDLIDHPLDKTRTVYSDSARNFLRYYSGNETLSLSCNKSLENLDKTMKTSTAEEIFGVPFDFPFGPGLLRCFDRDIFELLIREMPAAVENIPDELRRMGMTLYYAEKQDVNLDGLAEEWLIIIDDGMFVVQSEEAGYKAEELEYFWYGEDATKYSNVALSIERWMGIQDPVLTASTAGELLMLNVRKDFSSKWLNLEYDVENVLISSQSDPAQFQVFHVKPDPDEDYYDVPWSGYRWDPDTQRFKDDLIEYTLFIERDPDKAVELVNIVYPFLMEWKDLESVSYDLPRYIYLCALTYELSGDEQKAAEIYWQLWHDFPESHYALMARYKLEPVTP